MKTPPPHTITVGLRFQCMAFEWASTVAQTVKNLPAMRDAWVREMATHSSILAWEILWTEEPSGLQSMELQESDTTERLKQKLPNLMIKKKKSENLKSRDIL